MFNKLFVLKWFVFSLITFVLNVLIKVTGFQRYPTHGPSTFEQVWQEIAVDPLPTILICVAGGYLLAKYLPKLKIY